MHGALIAATLCAGMAVGQGPGALKDALKSKGWLTSYEAARAEAKRTGKPLMVVFRCEP